MRWEVLLRTAAPAAGLALSTLGCQRTCGCAEPATAHPPAHEWRSDASDYRAAGPPPPESSLAEDEAELVRAYGQTRAVKVQMGKAAYYGKGLAGNRTASGEIFDPERFTAAHRTLPFGTIVRVVRLDTGSHTYVRINDRGPFGNRSRIIDLAEVAARRIDMIRRGVVDVRLEIVKLGDGRRAAR
jgi:rare lipoprotein A